MLKQVIDAILGDAHSGFGSDFSAKSVKKKFNEVETPLAGRTFTIRESTPILKGRQIIIVGHFDRAFKKAMDTVFKETNFSLASLATSFSVGKIMYLLKVYSARNELATTPLDDNKTELLIGTIDGLEFVVHESELIIPESEPMENPKEDAN